MQSMRPARHGTRQKPRRSRRGNLLRRRRGQETAADAAEVAWVNAEAAAYTTLEAEVAAADGTLDSGRSDSIGKLRLRHDHSRSRMDSGRPCGIGSSGVVSLRNCCRDSRSGGMGDVRSYDHCRTWPHGRRLKPPRQRPMTQTSAAADAAWQTTETTEWASLEAAAQTADAAWDVAVAAAETAYQELSLLQKWHGSQRRPPARLPTRTRSTLQKLRGQTQKTLLGPRSLQILRPEHRRLRRRQLSHQETAQQLAAMAQLAT